MSQIDLTTKVEINSKLIRCSNCSHPIATWPNGKKFYYCPKNGGTYPSNSQFEECKHYDDKVLREKIEKEKKKNKKNKED